jgi:putative ABC transport system permease protein
MKLVSYSLKSLWMRRMDTLAALVALALLVFVLAASSMLSAGMKHAIESSGSPARAIVLQKDAFSEGQSRLPASSLGLVAAAPGVQRDAEGQPLVSGETVSQLLVQRIDNPERVSTLLVRGVSDRVFALRPEVRIVRGRPLRPGTNEAIVGEKLLGPYAGLGFEQPFNLSANHDVQVVGVFESGGSSYASELWVDLDVARSAFAQSEGLSSVTAELESPDRLDAVSVALSGSKQEVEVARQSDYYEKVSGGVADFILVIGIVETIVFSLGAILGAMLTLYASVARRRQEIGVLKALGFSRTQVMVAFLVEGVALSLAGAALGVGLALLTPLIEFRTLNGATGQELVFYFRPTLSIVLAAVGVSTVVGLLSGLFPALRAARLPPLEMMRA